MSILHKQIAPITRYKNLLDSFGSSNLKKLYKNPVFIISAPRSGSTLLFETLAKNPDFWTLGEECHTIYNAIPSLDPSHNNFESGCLTMEQATPETCNLLRAGFTMHLRNHSNTRFLQLPDLIRPKRVRFLEKTPRNSLNIPFLNKAFPDASYIYLTRDAASNINSIIEAWEVGLQDGSFITFRNLPDWHLKDWCMLLPKGWKGLSSPTIPEVAAFQWKQCNETIIKDLSIIPEQRKTHITYDDLINNPTRLLNKLYDFCKIRSNIDTIELTDNQLPISKTTITLPEKNKWLKRRDDIEPLLDNIQGTIRKINNI